MLRLCRWSVAALLWVWTFKLWALESGFGIVMARDGQGLAQGASHFDVVQGQPDYGFGLRTRVLNRGPRGMGLGSSMMLANRIIGAYWTVLDLGVYSARFNREGLNLGAVPRERGYAAGFGWFRSYGIGGLGGIQAGTEILAMSPGLDFGPEGMRRRKISWFRGLSLSVRAQLY